MRIVKNGDVHVSAPFGMPRNKVMAFIEEHRDWIDQARKKTSERQKQRAAFFNKLPLATRAQADEALMRLKALVEPMVERHAMVVVVDNRSRGQSGLPRERFPSRGGHIAHCDTQPGWSEPRPATATRTVSGPGQGDRRGRSQ